MDEQRRKITKRRAQAGETIAETLVALLISALALTMLAGSITSSAKLVQKSRDKLDAYYTSNEEDGVITMKSGGSAGTVTIKEETTDVSNKLSDQTIGITYYINDEFTKTPVISYQKNE